MASVDLRDAYFQIPLSPVSRKYLRFVWQDRVYQFRALCFGLSLAPQVFARGFGVVAALLHSLGFRLLRCLDDWLILGESADSVSRALSHVLSLCDTLGIRVNVAKSEFTP